MSDVSGKPAEFIGLVEMQPAGPVSELKVGDVVTFTHSLGAPVEYRVTDVAPSSIGVELAQ